MQGCAFELCVSVCSADGIRNVQVQLKQYISVTDNIPVILERTVEGIVCI